MSNPMDFPCPVCTAAANQQCVRLNGTTMPEPHSKRKHLAMGIKPPRRENFTQDAVRITREATEK